MAIIGGGVLGASTFFHLAEAGVSVCLLEQRTIASGISSFSGGVIRTFHLNAEQRNRALFSMNYFKEFSEKVGQKVDFTKLGYLYFPAQAEIEDCKSIVASADLSPGTSWLDSEPLQSLFPCIQQNNLIGAVWEPEGGYMDTVDVTRAWVEAGRELGGNVWEGTRVSRAIYEQNDLVGLDTNLGEIRAQQFVVAAGTSSNNVLHMFGTEATIYNKTIQVDIYQPEQMSLNMPCFTDAEFGLNGRGGATGILLGQSCDAKEQREFACHTQQRKAQKTAQKRYKWPQQSTVIGSYCSLDTFSDRALGYTQYMDPRQQVFLLSGFNGTAFKFAPYLGELTKNTILKKLGE